MKLFFWVQAAWGFTGSFLGFVVGITGGPIDTGFNRYSALLFTISFGFLWVHSAISKLKVGP